MVFKSKDVLRMLRLQRGLTQQDVADMLNIARGSYAKYETGANTPTAENLVILSQFYNVDINYLLLGMPFKQAMSHSYRDGKKAGEDIADAIIETDSKKRVRRKKQA